MNQQLFYGQHHLLKVWLEDNLCINENFHDEDSLSTLPGEIKEKCSFCEIADEADSKSAENELEKKELIRKISSLQMELKLEKQARAFIDLQNEMRIELQEKIEGQRNETFMAKTREFHNLIDMKLNEIDKLSIENQKQAAEIADMNRKYETLKNKNDILTENCQD